MKLAIVFIGLPFAALLGLSAYDLSETTQRFTVGTTWQGDSAVFVYTDGRLFAGTDAETIGLFAGGNPRLVAFDCEGSAAPLIAMEESDLPICGRIEPISNAKTPIQWASN